LRRVTSLSTIGDATEALHVSPTTNQHLVEGPTSLEVATRALSSVDSLTIILEVTNERSVGTVAPSTTSFCQGPGA